MKQTRYYRIEEGMLCVYDAPYADTSVSVSIVTQDQIKWYRGQFRMFALVGSECPVEYR